MSLNISPKDQFLVLQEKYELSKEIIENIKRTRQLFGHAIEDVIGSEFHGLRWLRNSGIQDLPQDAVERSNMLINFVLTLREQDLQLEDLDAVYRDYLEQKGIQIRSEKTALTDATFVGTEGNLEFFMNLLEKGW